jgi:hypothetical protein
MKIATFVRQIFPMMYFEVYDDDDVKEREVSLDVNDKSSLED